MISISGLNLFYYVYGSDKNMIVLQKAYDYSIMGLFPVVIYPEDNHLNDQLKQDPSILIINDESSLMDFFKNVSKKKRPDCIIIGEGEQLTSEQITDLFLLATVESLPIYVYAAKSNETLKMFYSSEKLMNLANKITEIETICSCGEKAIFSSKKIDNLYWSRNSHIDEETANNIEYVPLCPRCYMLKVGSIDI